MKFFKDKKAMTLTELIIAVMVGAMILIIIFEFVGNNINELKNAGERIGAFEDGFNFRTDLNKKIIGGYMNGTGIIDLDEGVGYDVLMLTNKDETNGFLYGVVDTNTMKLDNPSEYNIYKKKVLGYRSLSANEISEIKANSDKVYEKIFFRDKLYERLFVKDFQIDYYNNGTILDLNMILGAYYLSSLDGTNINDIVKKGEIVKFNLNF